VLELKLKLKSDLKLKSFLIETGLLGENIHKLTLVKNAGVYVIKL
jgi:hypothetical protein